MGRTKNKTGRKWWHWGVGSPRHPWLEMLSSSRAGGAKGKARGKSRTGAAEALRGKELKHRCHECELVSGGRGCWEHWVPAGSGN